MLLPCFRLDKAYPQAILALHTVLCYPLRLGHPGRHAFPGHDDGRLAVARRKSHLTALAMKTGGDSLTEPKVVVGFDYQSSCKDYRPHP
ncbi:hypothetical protein KUC_3013 [Vreelandella boliviensis LC1]|uniref:Uncharacterized protein n=1 Tax=Vreelandella boliviensis LC1 TaxID=1072583 RepID=A0A7U9C1S5_9GAMM|nr:hypothetical protein KUC_3013 [Halomonas boliviensis LC1]